MRGIGWIESDKSLSSRKRVKVSVSLVSFWMGQDLQIDTAMGGSKQMW